MALVASALYAYASGRRAVQLASTMAKDLRLARDASGVGGAEVGAAEAGERGAGAGRLGRPGRPTRVGASVPLLHPGQVTTTLETTRPYFCCVCFCRIVDAAVLPV